MQYSEFTQRLLRLEDYETRPGTHPAIHRMLGRSDAWFYTCVWGVVLWNGLCANLRRFDRERWARSSHQMWRIYERCGARCRVERVAVPGTLKGPAVFVANHMSVAETLLIACLILPFRDATIVVKESLLSYPFFGAVLRSLKPIAVTRKNAREDLKRVIEQGEAFLKAGRSIILFPQATRTRDFAPGQFNSLGARLASRAGVPLVPVALKTDFQGLGRVIKDLGPLDRRQPIRFRFGDPLDAGDMKAAHAASVRFIESTLNEWGVAIRRETDDA